jgi:hypothetical protein
MAAKVRKSVKRKNRPAPVAAAAPVRIDPRQRYTLPESAAALRFGLPTLYTRMAEDRIRVVRDGGRTFILGSELIRYAKDPTSIQSGAGNSQMTAPA